MSEPAAPLILSWDNPTALWDPIARTCQIWRALKPMKSALVAADVTWGFYADNENSDPDAEYQIMYMDGNNSQVVYVENVDILRYNRPATLCEITFDRTERDGSPDAGREITFSNEAGGSGDWTKTILTNSKGKGVFFAMPGNRLLMRIDGDMTALDFVVPNVRKIDSIDLCKYGSFVDTDPRRSIGWNE